MKIQKKLNELEIMVLGCEINNEKDGSVTFQFDFYLNKHGVSLDHVFAIEGFDGIVEAEVSLNDIFLVKKLSGLENISDEEVGVEIIKNKRYEVSKFIMEYFEQLKFN